MELIEQAIFTSAETSRAAGYQLAATSPGLCEADARELTAWGPSHDSLLDPGPQASSINFHPLPSGAFCIGRTTPGGSEYSGRRGFRVYTQCLVVSPQTLARFANNPFAVVRAAAGSGWLRQYDRVPPRLDALRLVGRTPAVDSALLARLTGDLGAERLAALVQVALGTTSMAIAGGPPAEEVIAGLLNCLPPSCRTEFSFSTGLKFSSRRPFRVVALNDHPEEQRRVRRVYHLTLLDLSGELPEEYGAIDSWPRLIEKVLRLRRSAALNRYFCRCQQELAPGDLPALGLQLLDQLDQASLADPQPETGRGDPSPCLPPRPRTQPHHPPAAPAETRRPTSPSAPARQQAHAPHPRFAKSGPARATADRAGSTPSTVLDADDPQVVRRLERLDDLVYEAIAGKQQSLEELKRLWSNTRGEFAEELVAESREQYLRYALSLWDRGARQARVRPTDQTINALEVLCLLFGEA